MRLLVTWDASTAERASLSSSPFDVAYLADGDAPMPEDGVLSFWPKRELAKHGLTWDALSEVAWVKVCTAGVNHIGWKHVPDGLQVMSTPGATGPYIGEYVLGAIIAWARGFQDQTRRIRAGDFQVGVPTRALSELHVGLVGFGGIGQAVAHALTPFGATVSAVSRTGRSDAAHLVAGLEAMDALPDMLESVDVAVVCIPLNTETQDLIDEASLARLGPEGLLVNVARGHVVQEKALHAWLSKNPSAHAHLDVWWEYPRDGGMPFTLPFHELDNVTMTPHNSPNVAGHRLTMIQRAMQDLDAVFETGELLHLESPGLNALGYEGDTR